MKQFIGTLAALVMLSGHSPAMDRAQSTDIVMEFTEDVYNPDSLVRSANIVTDPAFDALNFSPRQMQEIVKASANAGAEQLFIILDAAPNSIIPLSISGFAERRSISVNMPPMSKIVAAVPYTDKGKSRVRLSSAYNSLPKWVHVTYTCDGSSVQFQSPDFQAAKKPASAPLSDRRSN